MSFRDKIKSELEEKYLQMLNSSTPMPYSKQPKVENQSSYINNRDKYYKRLEKEKNEFNNACKIVKDRQEAKEKRIFKCGQAIKTSIFFLPTLFSILFAIDVLGIPSENIEQKTGLNYQAVLSILSSIVAFVFTSAIVLTKKMFSKESYESNKNNKKIRYKIIAIVVAILCGLLLIANVAVYNNYHFYNTTIIREPTEEETGLLEENCVICGKKIQHEIAKLEHTHKYTQTRHVDPTCTEEGYTIHICECGDKYEDNYVNALGHTEVLILGKDATCTKSGLTEGVKCFVCEEILVKQEVIKPLGHSYTKKEVKPTCTKEGYTQYTCKCGDTYKNDYVEKLEHIFGAWEIIDNPTCTEKGVNKRICKNCNYYETKDIDSIGHNYVNGICTNCGNIEIKDGYIYFGEYPQTLKEESVTIVSDIPDSDGYYLGSDGERYAEVVAKPYSSSYYFNDKTSKIVKGTTYYFKVEPIKWKIEEQSNGTYKLISDLIIDCQKYHSSASTRTIDGETIYANNYKYSDIRSWLNNEFINKAFTEELQEYINVTEVDNSALSTEYSSNKYACENTMDKIYLPSCSEMLKAEYGYSTSSSSYDTARQKQLTDYAKAKGCFMNTSDNYYNNGYYWLRSPNNLYSLSACNVYIYGDVSYYNVDYDNYGVAPTLTIQID